jgi:hypothetical protein
VRHLIFSRFRSHGSALFVLPFLPPSIKAEFIGIVWNTLHAHKMVEFIRHANCSNMLVSLSVFDHTNEAACTCCWNVSRQSGQNVSIAVLSITHHSSPPLCLASPTHTLLTFWQIVFNSIYASSSACVPWSPVRTGWVEGQGQKISECVIDPSLTTQARCVRSRVPLLPGGWS